MRLPASVMPWLRMADGASMREVRIVRCEIASRRAAVLLGVVVFGVVWVGSQIARGGSCRVSRNEASAVSLLDSIVAAQARFRGGGYADTDGDGLGEFGVFRELFGVVRVRTVNSGGNVGGEVVEEDLVGAGRRQVNRRGELRYRGYYFKLFLPGFAGHAQEEEPRSPDDTLDGTSYGDLAEVWWCCYAYPIRSGVTGRRTFFVNQDSVITYASGRARARGGRIDESSAGSAFLAGAGGLEAITGAMAVGTVGRDGRFWQTVK